MKLPRYEVATTDVRSCVILCQVHKLVYALLKHMFYSRVTYWVEVDHISYKRGPSQ